MPVGLRKRSWEDHVTPRVGTRYSYDDLDLICWHGVVNGNGSPTGPRERCASMPECRRHRPGVGSCSETDAVDGDDECAGDDDDGDGRPGRGKTFAGGLSTPREEVVIRAKMEESEVDLRGSVSGPAEETFDSDSHLTGGVVNSKCLDSIQDFQGDVRVPDCDVQSNCVDCHSHSVDLVDAGGQLTQPHDLLEPTCRLEALPCLAGSDVNCDKLRPILEVTLAESGEVGIVITEESDCPVSMTVTSGSVRNGPAQLQTLQSSLGLLAEQGLLGNAQNNKAEVTPDCESLIDDTSETIQADTSSHQASTSVGGDRDPKPQETPVQLRAQKSSRGERQRERSCLDSMVLLLMKLDQLDQEIESALSPTPSQDGTPTLKRRIISEEDLLSVEGDGGLTGSSPSFTTRPLPSSSQSSLGMGGAKADTVACTAFFEKDRAGG